jgi:hypothetical protein
VPLHESVRSTGIGTALCVFLRAGKGNGRDRNLYTPEALRQSVADRMWEGRKCFLNHPSATEEQDRPERDVHEICGFWSGVELGTVDGVPALMGTLTLVENDAGREAKALLAAALALRQRVSCAGDDCPSLVQFSISAVGESHLELIDGEQWNVVDKFYPTAAASVDLVTSSATGSGVVSLSEASHAAPAYQPLLDSLGGDFDDLSPTGWESVTERLKTEHGMAERTARALTNWMARRNYQPQRETGALLRRAAFDYRSEANSLSAAGQLARKGMACSICGPDCSCTECAECAAAREGAACSEQCACRTDMEETMTGNVEDGSQQILADGKIKQLHDLQQLVNAASDTQDPKVVAQLVQALRPYLGDQLDLAMQAGGADDADVDDGAEEANDPERNWLARNGSPRPNLAAAVRSPSCPACGHGRGLHESASSAADPATFFRRQMGIPLHDTGRSGPDSREARYFAEAMRRGPAAMLAAELVEQGIDDPARLFTALMASGR